MNARTGKIARAPYAVRQTVNGMLRDGATAGEVIKYLAGQGISGVNEVNVTNWRQGGFQDWLAEQARLEEMAFKREFALEIVRQNEGSKLGEAAIQLASTQLYDVISEFNISSLKGLLEEKPENYANVVNALAKLSKGALDIEKYRDLVREQKRKIEEAVAGARKGGLTPETLQTIEQAAAML